ncbi:kanamycin nucleotidyltransferase C-terminal domain-containing protein [Bacillus tianshenii]|nr:kanamycin nucleotidyltransferase C-terminal domain-containing protein [Bacillus tianshenii]
MLAYPSPTSREEKMKMIRTVTDRLMDRYGEDIIAVGVYGSTAYQKEGRHSDIEMHVVTKDGVSIPVQEFIYGKFKLELSCREKSKLFERAARVDDSWSIWAGSFVNVLAIHDPEGIFEQLKSVPFQAKKESVREMMRTFMIWEPYETMGKIRNNHENGNFRYIQMGARDLAWQTAKLIGLANRAYYTTRARTFEESLDLESKPSGYRELVEFLETGDIRDKETLYLLCENLWTGLNSWFDEMGIDYKSHELPF